MDKNPHSEIDEELIQQVTEQHGLLGRMVALMYREVTNSIPHRLGGIERVQAFHGRLLFALLGFVMTSASGAILLVIIRG